MPTAAKLVAAILTAALGYYVAALVVTHLPEQEQVNYMRETSAVLGLMVGWLFLGWRLGGGFQHAIGLGLSTSLVLFASGSLTFAFYEMIIRSLRKSYDGPFDALQGMMAIAIENMEYVNYGDVIGALVVGGILVGIGAEIAARRWS